MSFTVTRSLSDVRPRPHPVATIGNFDGRLARSGERVALRMPDTVLDTNQFGVIVTNVIHIAVNSVAYGTGGRGFQ